jgi:CRISPR-associated protein Csb2
VDHGGILDPCQQDLEALAWLERNPPDGMRVPAHDANDGDIVAFRSRTLEKRKDGWRFRKPDVALGSMAVGGAVAWTWSREPDPQVRASLEALCADTSHLGTAQSVVRLRVGAAEPTHALRANAQWWSRTAGDLDLLVPREGRTAARMDAYRADNPAEIPKRSRVVRPSGTEKDITPTAPTVADRLVRYTPLDMADIGPGAPWATVLIAEMDREIPGIQRVGWAVALHRALIKQIGDGAPAVLTGRYAPDVAQPFNRCAIQFLGIEQTRILGSSAAALALLMLPADITPADVAEVSMAWGRVRKLFRGQSGQLHLSPVPRSRPGASFWPAPSPGTVRTWRVDTAAINETRGQRGGWSLTDTAALSAGLVFRDRLAYPSGKGSAWYRQVSQAALAAGFQVLSAAHVRDGDLSRYVHRMNDTVTLLPYRADVDLGGLAGPCALTAIGQSRHLGGGLLVPIDAPSDGEQVTER